MIHANQECTVVLEDRGNGIALITLNRPDACNAVNPRMARELGDIARHVESDPSIRVAVLRGAGGRSFCAGADLKEVSAGNVARLSTQEGGFAGFCRLPKKKIWVAAVHGAVMAGGLEIMLACDFAYAADGARFALPEVKWGLIASEGGLYRLSRKVPPALAMEMIVSGSDIDAERAFSCGLVNRVVPAETLLATTLEAARRIAANAPIAVERSKALAERACGPLDEAELDALNRQALHELQLTEDFKEGPKAFIERRTPQWTGR